MSDIFDIVDVKDSFMWYFKQISSIPRGSGDNKRISDYLVLFAVSHGLKYVQDESLNVIIYKDASIGYENCPGVIIQGHMDMVCEKEEGSDHDFTTQGLELAYEEGYVYARKTTLGADDGIAMAYALAILADDTLVHPSLEVVITTDEETGMDGAFALDTSILHGKYMLNLDSEDEGIFLTSCAGGMNAVTSFPLTLKEAKGEVLTISVSGLTGGHSGSEIDKNRSNANIIMGRILSSLKDKYYRINLAQINGGMKDNAIPRSCCAKIVVDERMTDIKETIGLICKEIISELRFSEPNLCVDISVNKNDDNEDMWNTVMSPDCETHIIRYLMIVHDGVVKMSGAIPGLVETSLNLGVLKTYEEEIICTHSIRSSINSAKMAVFDKVNACALACGGQCTIKSQYPGWEYNEKSELRDEALRTYEKMTGKPGIAMAIHAGLECGIIKSKLPGLDIISYGPDIKDIHTTKEKMDVASARRVYDFTVELIKNICDNME